jgi:hypothetical protein
MKVRKYRYTTERRGTSMFGIAEGVSWAIKLTRLMYGASCIKAERSLPQIGQFKAGHGEFYAQDVLDEKSILVKFDWSAMMSKSPHFEQSFSNDGGKSWEVNWITDFKCAR